MLYEPDALSENGLLGVGCPFTVSVLDADALPEQTPLVYRLYVTVPAALGLALLKLAESVTEFPVVAESVVVSVGVALVTVSVSQLLVAGWLNPSPL